jgi:hypothetical protein
MQTDCSARSMRFAPVGRRDVTADFAGGAITSDAGSLLLGATDQAIGLLDRFAGCFTDGRDSSKVVHDLPTLLGQRVFGIALGYEDIADHDEMRHDPALGPVLGRLEARRPGCAPLAGKSTLNRLEHAPGTDGRYHRISYDSEAIENLFVDIFLESFSKPPKRIVLDVDATDDPVHGNQEGRFFHGFYDGHCYLPLYIFAGEHLLAAKLRRANQHASAGSVTELERIVTRIRERWPRVKIVVRGDGGFANDGLMSWCEQNQVDYVLGLARNPRLVERIHLERARAEEAAERTGQTARRFADFTWRTRTSWSRSRRVVAKAEHMPGHGERGANPRFVVTSLSLEEADARTLYEQRYCARGDMENRIKEAQLDLFADRTSAASMRANQLRLWFASMAYVLVTALRRIGLPHTRLEKATCGTVRAKLLKIGAQVRRSARRVRIAMASACAYRNEFELAHVRLCL